jgi:hypothetical protein
MADAFLVAIADGVLADYLAAFNLGRLPQAIRGRRGKVPIFLPGKQDFGVNEIFVSPNTESSGRVSRNSIEVDYSIEVGLCVRLRDKSNEAVDSCLLMAQLMADYFFDFGLSNGLATWMKNEVLFWGDAERIKSDGTFFALWDMTFAGQRSRA